MARPQAAPSVAAPMKGSFPLDHLNECRPTIESYFRCLNQNENLAPKCREEARAYLECRMDKDLMDKEVTEKWLPKTEFVDLRGGKNERRKYRTEDMTGSSYAGMLRAQPDGFERKREPSDEKGA